jgi:hypothetical protein
MGWYEIAKVVHFLGLIALFGFFVLFARAGAGLRTATSVGEVRTWVGVLDASRGMLPGAAVMFLASGLLMAFLRWRGAFPFVAVGMITLIVIWLTGAVVLSRLVRALRNATPESDAPVPAPLAHVILDPTPWGTMGALNGAALGVLFVMTTKIGWAWAIATVVLVAAIAGIVFTALVRRARDAAFTRR